MIITIRELKVGAPTEIHIGDPDTGLDGLLNHADGTYQNAETPTFEVRAVDTSTTPWGEGAIVTNGSGSLSYVAASNGRYVGYTVYNISITHGTKYWVIVTVTGKVRKRLLVQAKYDDA